MVKLNAVSDLLQALIAIPSVNPFAEDNEPALCGEKACAEFVANFLEGLGASVQLEEILPDRPNVIGTLPSRGDCSTKPKIILGPHLDTVTVTGMTIDPFAGEIRDGRIFGRGASDTKGTAAAMLWALHELGDRIADLNVEVTFVGFMGEENSQPGSIHFAKHHPNYDFAVIGEPTSLDVVYTHKGTCWIELTATGKAAHGASPHLGENAILKLANSLRHLDTTLRPALDQFTCPVLGTPTMNIGQIQGGIQPNIVPDLATARIDFRLTPQLHEHGFLRLLEQHLPTDGNIQATSILQCAPLNTDPSSAFIDTLAKAGSGNRTGAPWFCDAAHLAAVGIPSVAAGPGSIDQAHTADEWLNLKDLEDGVQFYKTFLETC